jgi:hypothetical protein
VNALWVAMRELWPSLTRPMPQFRLRLTHDVDTPWAALGHPSSEVAHSLAGDVIRRRDIDLAWRRARSYVDARVGRLDGDPYDTFDLLMGMSKRHGLRSTFCSWPATRRARWTAGTSCPIADPSPAPAHPRPGP